MLITTNDPDHTLHRSTFSPESVPPAFPAPSSSFLKILWDKICSIASKIFACFTCTSLKTNFFNAREIKLLRDDRLYKIQHQQPALLTFSEKDLHPQSSLGSSSDASSILEHPYRTFEEPLEELRSFLREFSVLGIDVIYENHMAAHIESTQALAPSLPPLIKSIAKLLVEIGDKAAKPLFKKFSEQKAKTIDPALQKIFKTLIKVDQNDLREKLSAYLNGSIQSKDLKYGISSSEYIEPLLDCFCTNEDQRKPLLEYYPKNKKFDNNVIETLHEAARPFWDEQVEAEKRKLHLFLEEQLCEEFKDTQVPSFQSVENSCNKHIEDIVRWLLELHHLPLNSLFGRVDSQKEELIDNIFERAITLLVERKIDQYSRFLEKTIQGHLDTIIQRTLQKNARRIADFFSERLCELINSMQFTKIVDELIHDTVYKQIQGIIESQKSYKEEKEFLKKVEQHAQISPDSPESLEAKILAQNHLNSVNIHGGKEAYLEHIQLTNFSKQPTSSLYLQQIVKQEFELVQHEKDPAGIRRAAEKALYNDIAENLLNLMMPTRKKLGADRTIEESDPFIELWNHLYLPEEFYDLAKQCEQLTQEFITPETTALLENIKVPTVEIIKNLFKSTVKDLLKKKLVGIVQNCVEKITLPEKINEVNAEVSWHALNLMLLETFCRQELERNISEFIPLFHQLVTSSGKEKEEKMRLIQSALIKLSKSKFVHFNPSEFSCSDVIKEQTSEILMQGVTSMEWVEITRSIIVDIDTKIRHVEINQQFFDPQIASLDEISSIIKEIFIKKTSFNNPDFGKLAMDLIFGLGKMDSEWIINLAVKKGISCSMTEAAAPWRQSYHKTVQKAAEILKRKYLNPNAVKALFTQETHKPAEVVKAKLARQIQVAAAISHDIIMGIANDQGAIIAYGTKKILTEDPKKLEQVIKKAYKNFFKNSLINQNLAVNVCDKIFQSLATSSESLRIQENMHFHQIAGSQG